MDFHSVQKTIKDIFSSDKKYFIPRFQREYSWTIDELTELWKDVLVNLKYVDGKFIPNDYFMGSVVLVGNQSSSNLLVVDGQQRLTSITILFSALVQTYRDIGEEKLALGCYEYVEGKDSDHELFFRLDNERSSDFIKRSIQNFDKHKLSPSSAEEERLLFAYDFFKKKLREKELVKEINEFLSVSNEFNGETHKDYLKAIREQLLAFKTIYITVPDEDEAYNIFETLNAKGLDLSMADLVKNQIFKVLKDQHPTDYAKSQWSTIIKNLNERKYQTGITTFFRHFWISKYEHTTEAKIYKSFINNIPRDDKEIMKEFIDMLVEESFNYKTIASPHHEDWTQQEEKDILFSLQALSLFRVISPRPFLLAIINGKKKGKVSLPYLCKALKAIEHFHFVFSTICSSSASGLESKYSRFARKVRAASTKHEAHRVIDELIADLSQKKPEYDKFLTKFDRKLHYSDEYTKEKKIIQYLFKKIERYYSPTNEFEILNISIEHIYPQSSSEEIAYKIGNLLPLSQELNSKCGDKNFIDKIPIYKDSAFKTVEKFLVENSGKTVWKDTDITQRTESLADLAYNNIFTIS
ncbi:DUF262 domain-containing protein [Bacillus cereus]|uniref:DUF262 domain-containing protein n=1 Tax=Bacillus cereus TaxID=1396 RepID=UPI0015D4E179|nr:DUF262 domain-containing protein [Bacillus cereus]